MGKWIERRKNAEPIPELRDGDRISKDEFWRRYEASKTVRRAELIEGVVHVISASRGPNGENGMAPISNDGHGFPHSDLLYWLSTYAHATEGVRSGGPGTIRGSDDATSPEPDAILMIRPEFGGRTRTDEAGYLLRGPELIAEISNTTTYTDLGPKLRANQADGVPEYFVWRTRHRVIDWFQLQQGEYVPLTPEASILKSRVFPGLWLDADALTSGDMARVLAVVQEGITSPEHAKFVEKQRKKAAKLKR
jgi:hypothetical protein